MVKNETLKKESESGQAITEYILLLAIIVAVYAVFVKGLSDFKLTDRLTRPIKEDFASAYKYGHPKAKGLDEGDPKNHPWLGEHTRFFISPGDAP